MTESDNEKEMISDLREFNALRMQRMQQHQNKMKVLLKLMKNQDEKMENALINQITNVY